MIHRNPYSLLVPWGQCLFFNGQSTVKVNAKFCRHKFLKNHPNFNNAFIISLVLHLVIHLVFSVCTFGHRDGMTGLDHNETSRKKIDSLFYYFMEHPISIPWCL